VVEVKYLSREKGGGKRQEAEDRRQEGGERS